MHVITARNVNDALLKVVCYLKTSGVPSKSRAGDVLVSSVPVTTMYTRPYERVLFSPERDANPFFHLVEALWMLRGEFDLKTVEFYNRRMSEFSDDGLTLHGAYGRRWRSWFHKDQLYHVVSLLKEYPRSRRAIIQIWDAYADLRIDEKMKDVPCNICVHVQLTRSNMLDMTVFCRSNDAIWGAVGANAVHFSILQEYLATKLGAGMGTLYQISNNLHAYYQTLDALLDKGYLDGVDTSVGKSYYVDTSVGKNYYDDPSLEYDNIISFGAEDNFDFELDQVFNCVSSCFTVGEIGPSLEQAVERLDIILQSRTWHNNFLSEVALPMMIAYHVFRRGNDYGRYQDMISVLDYQEGPRALGESRASSDWLRAAREWVHRRRTAFERARDDGAVHDI